MTQFLLGKINKQTFQKIGLKIKSENRDINFLKEILRVCLHFEPVIQEELWRQRDMWE